MSLLVKQNIVEQTSLSIAKEIPLPITISESFFKKLPVTRYYGSKRRLAKWIYDNIKELEFNSVLDVFGGTSTVSLIFKKMGKQVYFNDALEFNTISAQALLANQLPVDESTFYKIIESIKPEEGVIFKNFPDIFYTDSENKWLDGAIRMTKTLKPHISNIILYTIFQACLKKRPFNLFHRANLYLRTQNVKRTFGNLKAWNTSFEEICHDSFRELQSNIWDSNINHTVLPTSDAINLNNGYDLVYIDPPYVGLNDKNEDYLKKYNFLEGLCNYDNWEHYMQQKNKIKLASFNKIYVTDWQKKKNFSDNLFKLISKHKDSIVVLSYVDNATPSFETLVAFFKENFSEVTVSSKELSHALSSNKKQELLFVAKP